MPMFIKKSTFAQHSRKALICGCFLLLASCATNSDPTSTANNALTPTGDPAVDQQATAFRNVQLWSKAYQDNKSNPSNIIGYAKALSSIGSTDRAIKVLTDGATSNPQNPDIIRAHGHLLTQKNLLGPALRKMQLALKYSPNDWRVYNSIGGLHSKMGENILAINSFKRALSLSPNNPNIHNDMGLAYILSKNLSQAERHLKTAVNLPNATAKMRGNYALALGLQGKYEQSRKMFLQDLTPAQANAYIAQFKKLKD